MNKHQEVNSARQTQHVDRHMTHDLTINKDNPTQRQITNQPEFTILEELTKEFNPLKSRFDIIEEQIGPEIDQATKYLEVNRNEYMVNKDNVTYEVEQANHITQENVVNDKSWKTQENQ